MTAADLLARLDSVSPRGAGRWSARCPAHDDRSPSLSVAEGERGILLHCWAGCSVAAITAALGLGLRDLFADADRDPRARRQTRPAPKLWRYDSRRVAGQFEDRALDLQLRAERTLAAARGLDSADWSDEDLDAAMKAVARACEDMERTRVLEAVAFELRRRGLESERERRAAA